MKFSVATTAKLLLAGSALAVPLESRDEPKKALTIVGEIAPDSLTCADTKECRTNEQVAQLFINAFAKYDLKYVGQIAAVLSLTAFESVSCPGRPGQGTSNMQMIDFNVKYAESIPELKDKVAAIGTPDTDDKKNQVLALVTDDEYNFGSGPWFLTTQCDKSVVEGLQATDAAALDTAFDAYMACVGVEVTPERTAFWTRAKQSLGISS